MASAAVLPLGGASSGDAPPMALLARALAAHTPASELEASVTAAFAAGDGAKCVDLLLASVDGFRKAAPPREVQSGFAVLASAAAGVGDEVMARVADAAMKGEPDDGRAEVRVRCLAAIFHVAASGGARADVLRKLLRAAHEGKVAKLAAPILQRVDAWVSAWNLPDAEARKVHLACVDLAEDLHKASGGGNTAAARSAANEALTRMEAYLRCFEAPGSPVGEAADVATRACALFLASPHAFATDLLALAAVKALAPSPAFELLSAFLTGTNDAFTAALAKHKGSLGALGLDEARLRAKARLCTLATAAVESRAGGTGGAVPYAQLKTALSVSNDSDVERAVLEGVRHGVVVAKLDQLKSEVTFEGVRPRTFGPAEWETLLEDLKRWQSDLEQFSALSTL